MRARNNRVQFEQDEMSAVRTTRERSRAVGRAFLARPFGIINRRTGQWGPSHERERLITPTS